jgi:hypothetical protein
MTWGFFTADGWECKLSWDSHDGKVRADLRGERKQLWRIEDFTFKSANDAAPFIETLTERLGRVGSRVITKSRPLTNQNRRWYEETRTIDEAYRLRNVAPRSVGTTKLLLDLATPHRRA